MTPTGPHTSAASRGHWVERTWPAEFAVGRRGAGRRFRAFVAAPVADWEPPLSAATAALAERATAAVRTLNASDADLLALEGLAGQLLRSEALASSRIEGLALSHRRLAQAALAQGHGEHRAEVLGNIRAMEQAVQLGERAERLRVEDVQGIHARLAVVPPLDRFAGRLRDEQGWIGGTSPANATFVPAPPEELPRLLADLCTFMNRDDLPAVAQAAIAHAQFELVHPFADGNGRVGRCLIHVLLRRRGVASPYVPPVSLALGADKDRYVGGLTAFREGQVDDWLAQFSIAVEIAALAAARFSQEVAALQNEWLRRAGPLRSDAVARTIVANLPSFPFITTAIVRQLSGKSDVTALNGLERLTAAGVLTRHRNRRRGDTWEAQELFTLLASLEAGVGAP